ncbi:hypothetical protein GA0074694_1701 [Micromonospora inyonensis]|uniref:Uncharacterized protein n=1 Tax=Micromonospora inyonensis TaxID=47866 RepID=A0A1C6RI21_9ACTN|nr:hypothetical protein GA0074694_1701 [Micromonospora inyonensis]
MTVPPPCRGAGAAVGRHPLPEMCLKHVTRRGSAPLLARKARESGPEPATVVAVRWQRET